MRSRGKRLRAPERVGALGMRYHAYQLFDQARPCYARARLLAPGTQLLGAPEGAAIRVSAPRNTVRIADGQLIGINAGTSPQR